jgi:predicted AlkP superfamily phosphohydrolase/phosphomutase
MRRALVLVLLLAGAGAPRAGAEPREPARRLVVLGIDGLDPGLLGRFMQEGALPAFAALAERGGFMQLATSVPPQSPVAWSDFITGMGPGEHGVFDFVALDRATLQPYLSTARVEQAGSLPLGRYRLPLGGSRTRLLRDGRAFWEILEQAGIPATIFQIPANYPPVPAQGGALSGMGTPDLQGTSGIFRFFTADPLQVPGPVPGGVIERVRLLDGSADAALAGPPHPFEPGAGPLRARFELHVDAAHPLAEIRIGAERVLLAEGEWSRWLSVRFDALPLLARVPGMVRFYLQSAHPLRLYASPVNIDPADPAQPIAAPASYSRELVDAVGRFYTEELPEDTKALAAGVLSPREFLAQSELVLDERRRLLRHELARFRAADGPGFLFFYVPSVDLRSHMLWRHFDTAHPHHAPATPPDLATALRSTYVEIDGLVSEVAKALDPGTHLVVMSDHGFAPFRRQAHLNRWLEQGGYLVLREPARRDAGLEAIDWSRTRAFALGLNSLYLNVRGREREGIVPPAERASLAREIAERLREWRDGEQAVVSQPLLREEVYSGPHLERAPDILVGYARGYRASWSTTSGEVSEVLVEDNVHEWSGDHCMDAREVPGLLVSGLPLLRREGGLRDLTVSVLGYYGVAAPPGLRGQRLF